MKKSEFIAAIAEKTDLSKSQVEKTIDAAVEVITETCRDNGDEINIPNLGKFKQKVNAARKGVNPLTGNVMDVPESHTLALKVSSSVKKVVEKKPAKKAKK